MARHIEKERVGADDIRRIEKHQQLSLRRIEFKLDSRRIDRQGVVAQPYIPQHAAHVARAGHELTPLGKPLEVGGGIFGEVGVGVTFEHLHQYLLEFLGLMVGDTCKSLQKHEFGHQFREREIIRHLCVDFMHAGIVVVEICLERLIIVSVLILRHAAQRTDIVGIAQRHAIFRIGELAENQLPVAFGLDGIARTHKHKIEIIICVEAVDIVGVAGEQRLEFPLRCGEILHFVLEYHTHIVQTLLNDVVGGLLLEVGAGNLFEVIFGEVRIVLLFEGFLVGRCHGVGGHVIPLGTLLGFLRGGGAEIVEIECLFVAASPVILEFSVAPPALEFGAARIFRGRVVEIP